MSEKRIYINSLLQKTSGDDTKFVVDLGTRYDIKRLVLNQFICDNLFENFYDIYRDFTYQFIDPNGKIVIRQIMMNFYVTQDEFIEWFNAEN